MGAITYRVGCWSVETLLPRPASHNYPSGSRTAETLSKPNFYQQPSVALACDPMGVQFGNQAQVEFNMPFGSSF